VNLWQPIDLVFDLLKRIAGNLYLIPFAFKFKGGMPWVPEIERGIERMSKSLTFLA
jgi:hypothetical protein